MTPAEIAATLTKAQREALAWVRPHSLVAPMRRGGHSLPALGLVIQDGAWFTITPLGLAVRAILMKAGDGECS
jgi:hypothetical protein